jgi:FkbM family methyltransferase
MTSRLVKAVRLHAVHVVLRARLHGYLRHRRDLIRLGSELCGWWVPAQVAAPGAVAYCAGAGEDITFDLALLARGCSVTTLDPTPRAVAYVKSLLIQDERFRFVPVGVWSEEDAELPFYAPRNPSSSNVSAVNLHGTSDYILARVKPVQTLMTEFGDTHIDILKLDIEGAEYRVLESLLESGPLATVLCVEFDQPQPPSETIRMVRKILGAGYELVHIEFYNYTFVRVRD